jgi:colicin import membrane protein
MATKKEKTEVALIIPPKIQDVITTSGLELTKAQNYAKNYLPFIVEIQEKIDIVNTLVKGEIGDVGKARRVRLDISKINTKLKDQKAKDKESLLVETRYIDKLYNTIDDAAKETQGKAKEIEDHFDNLERERLAKLKADRTELLSKFEVENLESLNLETMSEDVFDSFLKGCETKFLAKKEEELRLQKEKEEADKLKAVHEERKNQLLDYWSLLTDEIKELDFSSISGEIFEKVLAKAVRLKTDKDAEVEKQRVENERIKAELEVKQKIRGERAKILQPYIVFIRDYNTLIEKNEEDFQKEFADIKKGAEDHWEFERKQQIAKQAEQERLQKIEAELKAKKDAEEKAEKEKLKKEKELAKSPIKKQLKAWVDTFKLTPFAPKNETAQLIFDKFEAFKVWAEKEIEKI